MNNNTAVIGGIVVVGLLILGGIFIFTQNAAAPSGTATSTPTGGGPGAAQEPGAPRVTTSSASAPYDTTASVTGFVNPQGPFTTYWFEYGTTQNLGSKSAGQLVGSGYTTIATPAYLTGLAKNTTYYYRLVAENSFGTQSGNFFSFQTNAGTPAPVGSAPAARTLAATGITRVGASLSGEVNPNRASTQFWFEYGKTPSLGVGSALQSVGDGSAVVAASLSLSSLEPATTYYFRLNAQNRFGVSNGTILNFKTAGPAATTTAVPVVTTQVPTVGTTTATLRGTVNPSDAQTTYWFEYSTDSLLGSVLLKTTPQRSVGAGADTASITANVTGLRAATTYYYRTVAQNSAGTVRGDKVTFTTK